MGLNGGWTTLLKAGDTEMTYDHEPFAAAAMTFLANALLLMAAPLVTAIFLAQTL
jgi:hypothetical protein